MALDSKAELESVPIRVGVAGAGVVPLKSSDSYTSNDLLQLGGYYRGITLTEEVAVLQRKVKKGLLLGVY